MEKINSKKHLKQKGQSTIEFIMTFIFAVGFIFLFLKMAMNYTDGYMVHHATFMASRAYLVSDENRDSLDEGDQRAFEKAKQVFSTYMPDGLVKDVDKNVLKENGPSDVKYAAFIGLYAKFTQQFSMGFVGGKEPIDFISESFLGREPTRSETRKQVCESVRTVGLTSCNVHVTLEDNGG